MIYKIAQIECSKLLGYFFIKANNKKDAVNAAQLIGDGPEEAGFKDYVFIEKKESMKKFKLKHIAPIDATNIL